MTLLPLFRPSDWDSIDLVAFDVDGTLYRQGPLHLKMALDLLLYATLNFNLKLIMVLRAYRHIRERLANEEVCDFDQVLVAETAAATASSQDSVRAIVAEWVEQRPLTHLAGCRYPGVLDLFAGLRRNGKVVGIFSDYPATEKLAALGLTADHVVSAGDEGIGLLKPNCRGLEALIAAAGVRASATMLIGDRAERDGIAARRAGAWALIKSSKPIEGWQTFTRFDDALFAPFLNF